MYQWVYWNFSHLLANNSEYSNHHRKVPPCPEKRLNFWYYNWVNGNLIIIHIFVQQFLLASFSTETFATIDLKHFCPVIQTQRINKTSGASAVGKYITGQCLYSVEMNPADDGKNFAGTFSLFGVFWARISSLLGNFLCLLGWSWIFWS